MTRLRKRLLELAADLREDAAIDKIQSEVWPDTLLGAACRLRCAQRVLVATVFEDIARTTHRDVELAVFWGSLVFVLGALIGYGC